MNRDLSKRELVLLAILAVLLLSLGYVKLIFEPINSRVERLKADSAIEQTEIDAAALRLDTLQKMEAELAVLYAEGSAKPIPKYDNSDKLMLELHAILSGALDYTLNFSKPVDAGYGYIMRRTVNLSFRTSDYWGARLIFNAISRSDNLCQISNVSIKKQPEEDEGAWETSLVITFFEIVRE